MKKLQQTFQSVNQTNLSKSVTKNTRTYKQASKEIQKSKNLQN